MTIPEFRQLIWQYYADEARSFPWRETFDPYHIMVSEIMLQQTQTYRVEPKYLDFLKRFPTLKDLASATPAEVLTYWQGLGYNRRALALHKAAGQITQEYESKFPNTLEGLVALPGIGEATASAILAFAFNKPVVFIETNIRRVFIHLFFEDSQEVHDKQLFPLIQEALEQDRPRHWYYALMDYGAMLAKKYPNPNRRSKHYAKQSTFAGSNRQLRGQIIRTLTKKVSATVLELAQIANELPDRVTSIVNQLQKEGFIEEQEGFFTLRQK